MIEPLAPQPVWTILSDAPLQGMMLAREPEWLLTWDQSGLVTLLDRNGERRAAVRVPDRIIAGAISADGSLAAFLVEGPRLWLLDSDLEAILERSAVFDAVNLAIDPLGRYVAVTSKACLLLFYSRQGKQAGKFEPRQPLSHLQFLADRPKLIGASSSTTLMELDVYESAAGRVEVDLNWQQSVYSTIGRLSISGDGGLVLASCHNQGVQRFDSRGVNDGCYQVGGTVTHAVTDFPGRSLVASTLEGDLHLLGRSGQIRWSQRLPRSPVGLEFDALGRYLIYADDSGHIVRLAFDGETPKRAQAERPEGAQRLNTTMRSDVQMIAPAWSANVAKDDDQAASAALAVLDDPPRVAVMTGAQKVQIFDHEGRRLSATPEVYGSGRILKTAPGWVAAATDRSIALIDFRKKTFQKLDLSLVQITHLEVGPDTYGLVVIQESDRIGRATTPAGRWVWRRELSRRVEDLVVTPDGRTAVSTEDGKLLTFDLAGQPAGEFESAPPEALALVPAPETGTGAVVWITLARQAQSLRGHAPDGRVVWQVRVPWVSWQMQRVGKAVIVWAHDGKTFAIDGSGRVLAEGPVVAHQRMTFGEDARGEPYRLIHQGNHLICSSLLGKVRWRTVLESQLGPVMTGQAGVAALLGRDLTWFRPPRTGAD